MSLLPSATFAGPSQAEALWAVAGSTGPGGGVTQLVAGANITLDPPTGEGVVTINATGGGGGGVTSIVAGPGIGVSSPAGDVTVSNTGVTSIVAGSNITISAGTGGVTINAALSLAPVVPGIGFTNFSTGLTLVYPTPTLVTTNAGVVTMPSATASTTGWSTRGIIQNASWTVNTNVMVCLVSTGVFISGLDVNQLGGSVCCTPFNGDPTQRSIFVSGTTSQLPNTPAGLPVMFQAFTNA